MDAQVGDALVHASGLKYGDQDRVALRLVDLLDHVSALEKRGVGRGSRATMGRAIDAVHRPRAPISGILGIWRVTEPLRNHEPALVSLRPFQLAV